jgi:serine protease
MFAIDVPVGATGLSFTMSGGSGDADLYVRFGSEPTTSSYDCRPYLSGNDEVCDIRAAEEGRYYAMVDGYAAFYGVSFVGSYEEGSPTPTPTSTPTPTPTPDECASPGPDSSWEEIMDWLRCQNPWMP